MLKVEIAVKAPSVWERIKELRRSDPCFCAPLFKVRLLKMMEDCKKVGTLKNGELFDPIIFETERVDELQKIYFQQGTTKAPTAIYAWHFYRLAADIISLSKEWKVSDSWWKKLAEIAEDNGLQSGYRWVNKDEPHVYFGGIKKSPSDLTRNAYFGNTTWRTNPKVYDGAKHEEALLRVWKITGAL
jgi:hypothetical protein